MKRNKVKKTEEAPDTKVTFLKIGGGSCRINGRIIKPGQKITVEPDWIPISFRSFFKPIGKDVNQLNKQMDSPIPGNKALYEVKERGTKGLFDVINKETQKPLNEKGLTKEEAEALQDALNT